MAARKVAAPQIMTGKILIVEDNELNMKLFKDVLSAYGYDTIQAHDGHNVVAMAREHRPDLIIMDIQLPVISGLDVTRQLKDDDDLKSIPIIAVTAFAMKGDEERILEGGCEAYISKPISMSDFVAAVKRFVE